MVSNSGGGSVLETTVEEAFSTPDSSTSCSTTCVTGSGSSSLNNLATSGCAAAESIQDRPVLSLRVLSAPASRSCCATSAWPSSQARCNGVRPLLSTLSTRFDEHSNSITFARSSELETVVTAKCSNDSASVVVVLTLAPP